MRYLGLDVHSASTVWTLLDGQGEVLEKGKVASTKEELARLVRRLSKEEALQVGQEVGTMTHFVHDLVSTEEVEILSFNAQQLRQA